MNIGNYIMTPAVRQVAPPPPPSQPQAPVAMNTAALVAQTVTIPTATQTTVAAQAVGNGDGSRQSSGRGQAGLSSDTRAQVQEARTNRTAAGGRGAALNIRV